MKVKKLCQKFDIFKTQPSLYIHKQDKICSILGVIFSFIFIGLSIFFSFNILNEIFQKKHFTNSYNLDKRQKYNPPRYKYPFVFKFDFFHTNLTKRNIEDIISVKSVVMTYDSQNNYNFTKLNNSSSLKKCKMNEEFKKYNLEDFENEVTSYLCVENEYDLDDPKRQNQTLIGYFILKCVNSTENNYNCVDKNYIDNYVKSIRGRIFIFDYDIVHNYPGNPFKASILEENEVLFNPDEFTIYKFTKKRVIYTDDIGIIFQNENIYMEFLSDAVKIEYPKTNIDIRYEGVSFLCLDSEWKTDFHYRRYKKFSEGLSEVYAIIKISSFLFKALIGFFQGNIYMQKLINLVFIFNDEEIQDNQRKLDKLRNKFIKEREMIEKLTKEENKLK